MVMGVFEKIIGFFQEWFGKLSAGQKRRLVLVCTAVFVIILIFSVIMSMISSLDRSKTDRLELDGGSERFAVTLAIPAEELFLGDEPDYLPGVLLERDRRESWTEQDAYEFWQDPLRTGEEQWREKIEAAIDEFLERIP